MIDKEVCLYQVRKLILLLEEDEREIENGIQGELLEKYRNLVHEEINAVIKEKNNY